jgi:integrase
MQPNPEKFDEYLRTYGLRNRTKENYMYYYNKFFNEFSNLNPSILQVFLGRSPNNNPTARSFIAHLKEFGLNNIDDLQISKEEEIELSKCKIVKGFRRLKSQVVHPLTHEQILLMVDTFDREIDKLTLLFNYYCGLRIGELLGIREGDFNWNEWLVDRSKMGVVVVHGKGGYEGKAYIPVFLMNRLFDSTKNNLIPKPENNGYYRFILNQPKDKDRINIQHFLRVKQRDWNRRLNEVGIKAGLTKFDEKGKVIKETSVHAHRLRHSFASHLLKDKKLDIRYIKDALRHKSIVSTQIYTHLSDEDLMKKLGSEEDPYKSKS